MLTTRFWGILTKILVVFFIFCLLSKADDQALQVFFAHFNELDLETTDILGMTPLAASVNRSNIKAAKALLIKGASVNCDGSNGYYLMRAAVFNANIGEPYHTCSHRKLFCLCT